MPCPYTSTYQRPVRCHACRHLLPRRHHQVHDRVCGYRHVPQHEHAQPARRAVQLGGDARRSEEHTSELQSRLHLVCRLLLEKKKKKRDTTHDCKEENEGMPATRTASAELIAHVHSDSRHSLRERLPACLVLV